MPSPLTIVNHYVRKYPNLPDDIYAHLFSFCSLIDIIRFSRTSSTSNALVYRTDTWYRFLQRVIHAVEQKGPTHILYILERFLAFPVYQQVECEFIKEAADVNVDSLVSLKLDGLCHTISSTLLPKLFCYVPVLNFTRQHALLVNLYQRSCTYHWNLCLTKHADRTLEFMGHLSIHFFQIFHQSLMQSYIYSEQCYLSFPERQCSPLFYKQNSMEVDPMHRLNTISNQIMQCQMCQFHVPESEMSNDQSCLLCQPTPTFSKTCIPYNNRQHLSRKRKTLHTSHVPMSIG